MLEVERFMEENKEKWAAADRELEAERQRRQNLGPMERLREDGQTLQREIVSNQDTFVTLEVSRSARARCRAEDDCIYAQAEGVTAHPITTKFRIRVDGVTDLTFWRPKTHYYHVACFDHMVDLADLIPKKFQLDHQRLWGLLIRRWFKHTGRINLEKLATYIKEFETYRESHSDFSTAWTQWTLGHGRCEADQATCACPPKPQPPEKPVLKDYTTGEEETCSMGELMKHPNFDDMCDEIWFTSRGYERVHPETDGQSE
jgi:hypothetical protein